MGTTPSRLQHARPSLRTTVARAAECLAVAAPVALATAPTASATTTSDLAKPVVPLGNAERKKVGCGPVRVGVLLTLAAQRHSVDMAKYSYFSHTSRDGRSPWQRIRAVGYYYGSAENIAAGQTTAKSVVNACRQPSGRPSGGLWSRQPPWSTPKPTPTPTSSAPPSPSMPMPRKSAIGRRNSSAS